MTTATTSARSTANDHTNHIIGAWAVLMVLTAATWWLGADHDLFGLGRNTAMVSILVLTFGKVYVVGNASWNCVTLRRGWSGCSPAGASGSASS